MKQTLITTAFLIGTTLAMAQPASENKDIRPGKVLFYDSFETPSALPDTTVWTLCTYADNAWSQHFKYTEGWENVRVEDGALKLKGDKRDGKYRNGGVRTKKGFPGHTRLEVCARLSKLVNGAFPAIWQMPVGGMAWPRSGEIDLMEWVQSTPYKIYQTVHTYFINGADGSSGVTNPNPDVQFDATAYHIYAVDRTDDAVIFYVDGRETFRYLNQHLPDEETQLQFPFNKLPFDIILNFSLGGTLNGKPTWAGLIDDENLPGELWIDWVKVSEIED